jgi:hypothetical protein
LSLAIVNEARVQLVHRLDDAYTNHRTLFLKVVRLINDVVVPELHRMVFSGKVLFRSKDEALFGPNSPNPLLAATILIDVMVDRGFSVSHQVGYIKYIMEYMYIQCTITIFHAVPPF